MKKKKKGRDWVRVRIYFAVGVFFFLFGVVLARAFQVQVLDSPNLTKRANYQHSSTIDVMASRGGIYDARGNELAVSIVVDSVYAHPRKVKAKTVTARAIASLTGQKSSEVRQKLKSSKNFVWIKRQVDLGDEGRKKLRELDGVGSRKKSRRYYPNHHLAANLIGFEGIDSKGLEGVELAYDKYLKGVSLKVSGQRDARGRVLLFENVEKTAATSGMDVTLTIDKSIQYIAENALARSIKSSSAKGGMVVVMDPATGEILAMANAPTYDPNRFHRYGPDKWRNRVVTDAFEPGSVLKVFLLASVLEEGVVEPNDIFFCENGSYKIADRTLHDVKKHGWLSLANIIKYSSNIGSAKVGRELGKERLYRSFKRFGFGERTGIDLPGEAKGALRHYKNWSGVTLENVSFGQGISVTGLQLASALGAIANGGYVMKPYVVKNITNRDGEVVFETSPTIINRVISAETARKTTKVLLGVTEKGGTGERAAIKGFGVAGKTGTAQKPNLVEGGYKSDAYIASFIGFVPTDDPKLVIFVSVDEPQSDISGGRLAAPLFKEIAKKTLAYLSVFPEGSGAPLINRERAPVIEASAKSILEDVREGKVPDFSGRSMRSVIKMANRLGAEVDLSGSGVATRQRPSAGRNFKNDTPIKVWFQ